MVTLRSEGKEKGRLQATEMDCLIVQESHEQSYESGMRRETQATDPLYCPLSYFLKVQRFIQV